MSEKQWEIHATKLSAESAVQTLNQLAQWEQELDAAKEQKDRRRQRETEDQIRELCDRLVKDWPYAFHTYLEAIDSPSADTLRNCWQAQLPEREQIADGLAWLERLGLEHSPFDSFATLPRCSFGLELRFALARPYLSRDDDAFYIIDNPVRKDKVFKVPFVAPTSWKGSLRAAATRGLLDAFTRLLPDSSPMDEEERKALLQELWDERGRRVMLFGNEKQNDADFLNKWLAPRLFPVLPDESEKDRLKRLEKQAKQLGEAFDKYLKENHYRTEKIEGRQGRLFCFPTFFNQIGLEMINPHDRARRVGKNPILFECVPTGATGTFRLLYVPYDFPGEVTPDEAELRKQVQAGLPLVAEAVRDLLLVYGFGAKTSSGFGSAEPVARQVTLGLNVLVEQEAEKTSEYQDIEAEEQAFVARFGLAEFPRWDDEELAASDWGRKRQSEYKKLRDQHPDWDAEARTWREPSPPPKPERRPIVVEQYSFELARLPDAVKELLTRIGGVT